MKIVIMGPPASGKGTQSKKISDKYGIKHISTGSLLRDCVSENNKKSELIGAILSSGNLVPDRLINKILYERISKMNDFILDGYPRNLKQAKLLCKKVDLNAVILVDVEENDLLQRIKNRRVCSNCEQSLNVSQLIDGKCPYCNSDVEIRNDDKEEVFRKRFSIYTSENEPIIKFFEKKNLLYRVKGDSIEEVFENIVKTLDEVVE